MEPDDIEPITTLKRDAAALIDRASERRAPIVITQNGRATAVLQDVESYAEERRAFAVLKLAVQGERDVADGRRTTLAEHRERIRTLLRDGR
jgi:prevent-host-death family protein